MTQQLPSIQALNRWQNTRWQTIAAAIGFGWILFFFGLFYPFSFPGGRFGYVINLAMTIPGYVLFVGGVGLLFRRIQNLKPLLNKMSILATMLVVVAAILDAVASLSILAGLSGIDFDAPNSDNVASPIWLDAIGIGNFFSWAAAIVLTLITIVASIVMRVRRRKTI